MTINSLLANQGGPIAVFAIDPTNAQNFSASGSHQETTVFGTNTIAVMLSFGSGGLYIDIGPAPTATTSTTYLPGPFVGIFQIPKAGKISILSADMGTPVVSITPLHNLSGPSGGKL